MTFNPLGMFDPGARVDPAILTKARSFFHLLPDCPAGSLERGYYHWTAGHYDTLFEDYHGECERVNGEWLMKLTHDPRDNAKGVNDNDPASHTYRRNTGAIGISIAGMYNATTKNFGDEPITVVGLHHLCAMMAAFCKKYGIDTHGVVSSGVYTGEPSLLTHGEAAWHIGKPPQYKDYFGERWDEVVLVPSPIPITRDMSTISGNALRDLTHSYKAEL
jgi:hypothetical protein